MAQQSDRRTLTAVTLANGETVTDNFDIINLSGASFHVVKTGAGNGTAKLQYSNDGTNWVDVPTAQFPLASAVIGAGAVNTVLQVAGIYTALIRVTYTSTNASVVSGKWVGKAS